MSKDINTGSVREARMEAKKLARRGIHTHQQALDQVARDRGHRNWSAFLASEGEGGVRGSAERKPAPRIATSRDLIEETETQFLEDAADLKHDYPIWPLRLIPILGGAWWMFLLLAWPSYPVSAIIAFCVYFALTLAAGKAAEYSSDGFLKARRHLHSYGSALGLGLIAIAGGLLAYGFAYYWHYDALGSGIQHPLFDQANLAYVAGVTTFITSRRMHRAMTVAVPDSVRPVSREDLTVSEIKVVERPRLMRALALTMFGGTGLAIVGLIVLIGTTVALFVSHELPTTAFAISFGGIFAGIVIAMLSMGGIMLLDQGSWRPLSAARHRASRARRFLQAARKRSQAA